MELTDFLHVGTISHKLKDDRKFWGEHGQKWVCQSGDGTLKLTVFEE